VETQTVNADGVGPLFDGTTTDDPLAVYPNTIVLSLIGKIGGTLDLGTGTPVPPVHIQSGPGFVGSSYNQTILTSGRLFLGFNDEILHFGGQQRRILGDHYDCA
jgi:hypothetical protein